MGFDIVIICPAFEDICWVSDVKGVRLGQWLVVAEMCREMGVGRLLR